MRDIEIRRIMTEQPATVAPGDSLDMARERLEAGDLHHLPVVDGGRLVGIVSSSDLLKFYLLDDGSGAQGLSVRTAMQPDPVSIPVTASLKEAARKLSVGGFHALPVVEPDDALVGIVTSSDLVRHLLKQLPIGDGSLIDHSRSDRHRGARIDLEAAIESARRAVEDGDDNVLATALLALEDRSKRLRDAVRAADVYVRSGHGEREHSTLVRCLARTRDTEPTTL